MDKFGYRTAEEDNGVLPRLRIGAMASRYDLGKGEWIGAGLGEPYWSRDPFKSTILKGVSPELQISPVGTTDGHNLLRDDNFLSALNVDRDVPISPLFVKDLAGRMIYIGFGPDRKKAADWGDYMVKTAADEVDVEKLNPFTPMVVFPKYCRDVAAMEGKELLEEVFLTKFRSVEPSSEYNFIPSGAEMGAEPVALNYDGANLFPYKLRLDTFYVDGWKLPQTQMLFARGESQNVDPVRAKVLGDEMLNKWRERTPGQKYEDWLLELGGQGQIDLWFERGLTLIPTFEACNGMHVVSDDFELLDYWPGRLVPGLHEVMEERDSEAPAGTILQVLKPGFVTARHIEQAQVVVSNGSGYVTEHENDPVAMIPNLDLPHTRTIDEWGAVWVPTHPEHFEVPALWGWDSETGRFMQISGPIWDPLHYYYGSVEEVLKAFKNPMSHDENRWLVRVPEHMRNRFYPVVEMRWFDTFSLVEQKKREVEEILPQSMIKRVQTLSVTAGVGYHPLPMEFEYEVEPFWFPDLHPANRDQGDCPQELGQIVCPVIMPAVSVEMFLESVETTASAPWLADSELLYTAGEDAVDTYPFLMRYAVADLPLENILQMVSLPYLADRDERLLMQLPDWWASPAGRRDSGEQLKLWPGMHDNLWDARQKGQDLVRFRHLFYQQNTGLYMLGYWGGAAVPVMEDLYTNWRTSLESGEIGEVDIEVEGTKAAVKQEERPVAEQAAGLPEEENL